MESEPTHVRFQHFDDYGPDYWTDWLPLPLDRRTLNYHRHAMKVEYKTEPQQEPHHDQNLGR